VVAPPPITAKMRDILGHVGAWAPRPEQIAVAKFLGMRAAIDEFHETMIRELQLRLDLLYDRIAAMGREGLPIRAIAPQGAIYLSVQVDLIGRGGITTNEQIRKILLDEAGFAVVPFQAFGLPQETGWFRLSVGAVSPAQIEAGLGRVRAVLARYA
jgi:aspartate aminotransferase